MLFLYLVINNLEYKNIMNSNVLLPEVAGPGKCLVCLYNILIVNTRLTVQGRVVAVSAG